MLIDPITILNSKRGRHRAHPELVGDIRVWDICLWDPLRYINGCIMM